MQYTKLKDINEYVSISINPMKLPDTMFEMYSVPIYETGHPEYLSGNEIGSNKVIVKKNDVLLCKINPRINRVWVVSDESEHQSIASSEWIVIRSNTYNPEFLAWYFRCPKFKKLMISEVTGIGGSLTRAQPKAVAEYPVPVLSIDEQEKIVGVLNKVNSIIGARKRELQKLDELIRARFVELFEDGESPIKTVAELCSDIVDCPHTTPKYTGELKNPAIRTSEIKKGYITWDSMRYVSDEEYEERVSRLRPEAGDIVYGREGTFGNAAVLPKGYKFCLGQRVMLLRPDYEKCTSEYLLHAVISDDVYRQAVGKNNASTVAHVNVKDVKQFKIPLPSFDKQNQFAEFVKQVDKSKAVIQKSLDEMQLLFDSLMQQYFG